MKTRYCLILAPIGVFVAQAVGCSSEFTSCFDSRTCAPTGGGGVGGTGEAGEGGGGAAGETGAAGATSEGGDVGVGGAPGEGGAAGEGGNDCAAGFKPCGAGKCIPEANCCSAADCTETCTTCSSTGACVAVKNADDLDSCAGTCDAAGSCKSKRGQTCQTAANGCISGTTCAPDGYCCNTACTESCQACDLTGFEGTCTPVASGRPHGNRTSCGTDATCAGTCSGRADGKCDFPTTSCGSGQTCAGTDSVGPAKCMSGSCVTPAPQMCGGNFACVGNACKTSCSADSDCLTGTFCQAGTCHRSAVQVAVGGNFACAVLNDGSVMCWGGNASRQLGPGGPTTNGNLASSPVPIKVTGLSSVKLIAAGASHVCALLTGGGVSCWGDANYGQLGPAVSTSAYNSATPVAVVGLPSGVTAVSSGDNTTCALIGSSGAVYCWGDNIRGELGTNAPAGNLSSTPVKIAELGVATSVSMASTGCAIVGGGLACWGSNAEGQAGQPIGGNGIAPSPSYVAGLAGVGSAQGVSTSLYITCAGLAGGGVYCWGSNVYGGLGNPGVDLGSHDVPVQVQGLTSGAIQVAAGGFFACALLSNGKVSCWGDQRHGALGDGVLAPDDNSGGNFSRSVVQVSNLTGVKSISVDGSACALLNNGSVRCWGAGLFGQLGNSAAVDSSVPVPVTGW